MCLLRSWTVSVSLAELAMEGFNSYLVSTREGLFEITVCSEWMDTKVEAKDDRSRIFSFGNR